MALIIGKTILQFRKEKQITQEKLAEILGVSTTAVCKWETGSTHPDIELLPVIADFFDISVDRLLNHDMCKAEADIKEQIIVGLGLLDEQKTNEALTYFAKLAYRFPNNLDVLQVYCHVKDTAAERSDDGHFKKAMRNDIDELMRQQQVLTAKMPYKEQYRVAGSIIMTHIKRKDFTKAEQMLEEVEPDRFTSPPFDYFSAVFWLEAHRGDREAAERKYFDFLKHHIYHHTLFTGQQYIYQNKPAQLIKLNNKLIQVYELFMDDISHKPYVLLALLHESNAVAYYKLDEKDKAKNELKKFVESIAHMPDITESCRNVISDRGFNGVLNSEDEEAYRFIKNTYENLQL